MSTRVYRFPWAAGSGAQVWIVHYGSKSTPLIAQLCREIGLQSRILGSADLPANWDSALRSGNVPKLIILSGGQASVYDANAPGLPQATFDSMSGQTVLLGICYGAQLLAKLSGGEVRPARQAEYGAVPVTCPHGFGGYRGGQAVMNHRDEIVRLPDKWVRYASTERCANALVGNGHNLIGVQFHPEMDHTEGGEAILRHAALFFAGCRVDYSFQPAEFVSACRDWLAEVIADGPALCGLSGGVDSSVAYSVGRLAFGPDRFKGMFIDSGWYREGELLEIQSIFGNDGNAYVSAADDFYAAIESIPYPADGSLADREYRYYEAVRKAIGNCFVETFLAESERWGLQPTHLVQGTNAADIIESLTGLKSHHNVTGLPDLMKVNVVEPLAGLYKFEIRQLAAFLGLPEQIVHRQPFPGPGLAIRSWGPLTRDDAPPLRRANRILEEVMRKHFPDPADRPCQYYAALAKLPSTGLMGDQRVIGYAWWIRMVTAVRRESYSTLGVFRPSEEFSAELAHRLTTETQMPDGTPFVRVAYEITGKPPSTTEPH